MKNKTNSPIVIVLQCRNARADKVVAAYINNEQIDFCFTELFEFKSPTFKLKDFACMKWSASINDATTKHINIKRVCSVTVILSRNSLTIMNAAKL